MYIGHLIARVFIYMYIDIKLNSGTSFERGRPQAQIYRQYDAANV